MGSLVEIRTKTRDNYIKIDPNGKIRNDTTLDALINRAYFQVQKDGGNKRPTQYANDTDTTVGGTQEYTLPTDFIKFELVRYAGRELSKTTKADVKRIVATMTSGTPYSYYIYGTNYGLYPIPNTSGIVDIEYYKKLPTLTSSQDSLFPDDFDDAVATYTAYLAFNSVEKIAKAGAMYADYTQMINSLLASYVYDDVNIEYGYQRAGYTPTENSTSNLR